MWGNVGVSAGGAVAKAVLRGHMGKGGAHGKMVQWAKEATENLTAAQVAASRPPRVVLKPIREKQKREMSIQAHPRTFPSRKVSSPASSQTQDKTPAGDPFLEGPPEIPDPPLVKAIWMGGLGGTAAIFGGGIALGQNTLLPAWAFFHAAGASASACKRNAFETVMHGGIFVSYWAGLWDLPGEGGGSGGGGRGKGGEGTPTSAAGGK